ncbi:glycosyltransferase [Streptomyces paromomycinus]|uniref:D-inositol 3-phosphate glycosyltransferase n=1 Tax=Streptomyces paromomycinus TaxID=92743 RepID=A0A401W1L6_STREY|nr:glycosyltransferase [Streptomyces paromomycinus]GCD43196.1 transferase [Streptomyces paromomycinus]
MRIGLLTEGGCPDASGETRPWRDRLVHGLPGHEFEVYTLDRGPEDGVDRGPEGGTADESGPSDTGPEARGAGSGAGTLGHARVARVAPLYGELPAALRWRPGGWRAGARGRRARRRFAECFGDLAAGFIAAVPPGVRAPVPVPAADGAADREGQADRFAAGLYGLAQVARDHGGLPELLRSEQAVRILESACRAPGALCAAHGARVGDLLAVTEELERALRPLSLDWFGTGRYDAERYGGDRYSGGRYSGGRHGTDRSGCGSAAPSGGDGDGLAAVDLCHATAGGSVALPGLLAKRFFGTPLLLTEYGVRLRERYLARSGVGASAPVRALLGAFETALAAETYAEAALVTPGSARTRRWQERCGAGRERLRTVYPGMDAAGFTAVPDAPADHSATLVWTGTVEPAKDLVSLLHAFARVHRAEPAATLRIVGAPGPLPEDAAYLAQCRVLAAQLFPDEAADERSAGDNPVSFEEVGGPGLPRPQDVYAAGSVLVLSSVAEGFPRSLVEAMLSGRATVSTDAGAVCEVIGGTGLVVPPRNPRALADACLALLLDPGRRARLGAAARARALELFTVEQNVAAFRGIYLELMSRTPCRPAAGAGPGGDSVPRLFSRPAESHVPGRWAVAGGGAAHAAPPTGRAPSWAAPDPDAPATGRVTAPVVEPATGRVTAPVVEPATAPALAPVAGPTAAAAGAGADRQRGARP